jgi:hypothetical protein
MTLRGLIEAQRILDRHVLQHMEECRDYGYRRTEYAFHLQCFVTDEVTKDMARAICRSLTDRGYAFYMRGLWSDEGYPGGAGYGITDKGAAYLETLCSDDPAILRALEGEP